MDNGDSSNVFFLSFTLSIVSLEHLPNICLVCCWEERAEERECIPNKDTKLRLRLVLWNTVGNLIRGSDFFLFHPFLQMKAQTELAWRAILPGPQRIHLDSEVPMANCSPSAELFPAAPHSMHRLEPALHSSKFSRPDESPPGALEATHSSAFTCGSGRANRHFKVLLLFLIPSCGRSFSSEAQPTSISFLSSEFANLARSRNECRQKVVQDEFREGYQPNESVLKRQASSSSTSVSSSSSRSACLCCSYTHELFEFPNASSATAKMKARMVSPKSTISSPVPKASIVVRLGFFAAVW